MSVNTSLLPVDGNSIVAVVASNMAVGSSGKWVTKHETISPPSRRLFNSLSTTFDHISPAGRLFLEGKER
jgi:hypothetical protein